MPFYRCVIGSSGGSGDLSNPFVTIENAQNSSDYPLLSLRGAYSYKPQFNLPLAIGSRVSTLSNFLFNAFAFNADITINSTYITNTSYMFARCYEFNKPVDIPDSSQNIAMNYMFYHCNKFNQRFRFPPTVMNAARMFSECYDFNSPLDFSSLNLSTNFSYLLENTNFNRPVNLSFASNGLLNDASGMFYKTPMNMPILIDQGSMHNTSSRDLLQGTYMGSDVIVVNENSSSVIGYNILKGRNNTVRINIYSNNIEGMKSQTTYSVIGGIISWTATTNGYYNTAHNVYILNNVSDALNNFNTAWNLYCT